MRKWAYRLGIGAAGFTLISAVCYAAIIRALDPADPNGEPRYFRVRTGETLAQCLSRAESEGLLRSAKATILYARLTKRQFWVTAGTYELSSAMRGDELARVLTSGRPIKQMILIREGLWVSEVAQILADYNVCEEQEALHAFSKPDDFTHILGFRVPAGTLEGFLFPDTYDMPPMMGARKATERMLQAFKEKVYEPLGRPSPDETFKIIIIASMIELEAAKDAEKPIIAGIIYNRLAKGMKLQIDATVNYAKNEMSRLFYKDYKIDHPYNTYKIDGLPPGPICSPGLKSIRAAMNPKKHNYLYYVAMPDGSHLFAQTYEGHLKNIETSRKALVHSKRNAKQSDQTQ